MVSIYGYFPNLNIKNTIVNKNEKIILFDSNENKTYKRRVYESRDGQTYINFKGIKLFIADNL